MRNVQSIIITLIALLAVGNVHAQQSPGQAKGFDPTKLYSFQGLDSINTFNGNLVITIPLSAKHQISPTLSYQLSLVYNGKPWDATADRDLVTVYPARRSNAGIGWR